MINDKTKQLYEVVNQISQMEQKLSGNDEFQRYFSRCRQAFEEMGISYNAPLHEKYSETRTDMDAHITGNITNNMIVTQVIKPVIFDNGILVQRGIVVVEGK